MAAKFNVGAMVRHLKSNTVYMIVLGPEEGVTLESTNEKAYLYRALHGDTQNTLWVRSQEEMEDGRFEDAVPNPQRTTGITRFSRVRKKETDEVFTVRQTPKEGCSIVGTNEPAYLLDDGHDNMRVVMAAMVESKAWEVVKTVVPASNAFMAFKY